MWKLMVVILSLSVISCNKQETVKEFDYKHLLAKDLASNNTEQARLHINNVRLTENMQNIISLYLKLELDSLVNLDNKISYIQQFYLDMNLVHQSMFDEIKKWVYLKQVYQHEISPPVRLLQRNELYLAPSKINFSLCPAKKAQCAEESRKKLAHIMSKDQIKAALKNMAIKDPCVNLSPQLKDRKIANKCLKKSQGLLTVDLLSKPRFNVNQWLELITVETL